MVAFHQMPEPGETLATGYQNSEPAVDENDSRCQGDGKLVNGESLLSTSFRLLHDRVRGPFSCDSVAFCRHRSPIVQSNPAVIQLHGIC